MTLALEAEFGLIRETWFHFNLLFDLLWLCGASIILKNIAREGLVLKGAVVEFSESAVENKNDVSGANSCLISSTTCSIVEDGPILHLLSETILVIPWVDCGELCIKNLLGLTFHKETSSVFLSVRSNDAFLQSIFTVFVIDGFEFRVGENFESLTHLIELKLVDLQVGGIANWVAPH